MFLRRLAHIKIIFHVHIYCRMMLLQVGVPPTRPFPARFNIPLTAAVQNGRVYKHTRVNRYTHSLNFQRDTEPNCFAMPRNTCEYQLLFLLCFLMKSCHAFKNDATEELYGHMVASPHETPNNASLNRARNGGRRTESRDQKGACFLLCL